jgi:hypothetical protein
VQAIEYDVYMYAKFECLDVRMFRCSQIFVNKYFNT